MISHNILEVKNFFKSFRRNTSKYNSDGDFSPPFLLNSFKNSVVAKEIENCADSVQLVQHDNLAGLSRHEVALGAEQRDNLGECALGALECFEFLERELNVIQFAVVDFHK